LNILHEYLIQHALKLPGTNYHFKCVKVPDTAPYWKAWVLSLNKLTDSCKMFKFYENVYVNSEVLVHMKNIESLVILSYQSVEGYR
jgi:hypothetical protein